MIFLETLCPSKLPAFYSRRMLKGWLKNVYLFQWRWIQLDRLPTIARIDGIAMYYNEAELEQNFCSMPKIDSNKSNISAT